MKISPIRYNLNFCGKNNSLKTGAAILILSAPAYAQEPAPVKLPDCFIYGIDKTENKTYEKIFSEIDNLAERDNKISAEEVVLATRKLWKNSHNGQKIPVIEEYYAEDTFDRLARNYNKKGSDNKTIDFSEYMAIMNDYKASRQENE